MVDYTNTNFFASTPSLTLPAVASMSPFLSIVLKESIVLVFRIEPGEGKALEGWLALLDMRNTQSTIMAFYYSILESEH